MRNYSCGNVFHLQASVMFCLNMKPVVSKTECLYHRADTTITKQTWYGLFLEALSLYRLSNGKNLISYGIKNQ